MPLELHCTSDACAPADSTPDARKGAAAESAPRGARGALWCKQRGCPMHDTRRPAQCSTLLRRAAGSQRTGTSAGRRACSCPCRSHPRAEPAPSAPPQQPRARPPATCTAAWRMRASPQTPGCGLVHMPAPLSHDDPLQRSALLQSGPAATRLHTYTGGCIRRPTSSSSAGTPCGCAGRAMRPKPARAGRAPAPRAA